MTKLQTAIFVFFLVIRRSFALHAETGNPARELSMKSFPEAQHMSAILQQPESKMDLAKIKLTIDQVIDPNIDTKACLEQIDGMVVKIRALLGKKPSSNDKMLAIKKYLYEKGTWNDGRPYCYDFDDPLGTKISNKLLPNYISSRKGNCIAMPFMFIILGEKLGIDVTASTAPLHVFVKYTDSTTGATINLEATSGANPTKDEWYRQQMPMTDEAIANGLYLQKLSKKETVSVMLAELAEYYFEKQEFEKSIAICDIMLEYYPKYDAAMLRKGSAYYRLLEKHFMQKYSTINQIPVDEKSYFQSLSDNNRYWFEKVESLGWREPPQDDDDNYLNTIKKNTK